MSSKTKFYDLNSFVSSKVGCLLLHQNETKLNEENLNDLVFPGYNPFFMPNVNIRTRLEFEKVVTCSSDEEKDKNFLYKTSLATDSSSNPLANKITVVIGSYITREEANLNSNTSSPMSLIWNIETTKPDVLVNPANSTTFRDALTWISPNSDYSNVLDEELPNKFLHVVNNLEVPNGSIEELRNFIEKRTWSGDCLWGGDCNAFLTKVDSVLDEHEKWRFLRLYITQNFAWQTKIAFFPVDGLHRLAISDMIFNGIVPPSSNDLLQTKVTNFSKCLVVSNKMKSNIDSSMLYIQSNDEVSCVDTHFNIFYCVPDTIDNDFCTKMREKSASTQSDAKHQSSHTVIHLLQNLLQRYFEFEINMDDNKPLPPKYLFDPSSDESLSRLLSENQGPKLKYMYECLENEGFCKDREDFINNYFHHMKNKNQYGHPSHYPNYYINIWLKRTAEVMFKRLCLFNAKYSGIAGIQKELINLSIVSAIDFETFWQAFKTVKEGRTRRKGALEMHSADLDCPYTFETMLNDFLEQSSNDKFGKDPYKRPIKPKSATNLSTKSSKYFPAGLLDVLQILLYCHFSPGSHQSVVRFLDEVLTIRPNSMACVGSREIASMTCIRSLLFTIRVSVKASLKAWNQCLNQIQNKAEGKRKESPFHPLEPHMRNSENHMRYLKSDTISIFLTISAIRHSCSFFGSIGLNSEPHFELTELSRVHRQQHDSNPKFLNVLERLNDLNTFYSISFLHYIFEKDKIHKKEPALLKVYLESILQHSLAQYLAEDVTATASDDQSSFCQFTKGFCQTLSPALNERKRRDNSSALESVIEILWLKSVENSKVSSHEEETHRIDQYVARCLDAKVLLDYCLEILKEPDPKESSDNEELNIEVDGPNVAGLDVAGIEGPGSPCGTGSGGPVGLSSPGNVNDEGPGAAGPGGMSLITLGPAGASPVPAGSCKAGSVVDGVVPDGHGTDDEMKKQVQQISEGLCGDDFPDNLSETKNSNENQSVGNEKNPAPSPGKGGELRKSPQKKTSSPEKKIQASPKKRLPKGREARYNPPKKSKNSPKDATPQKKRKNPSDSNPIEVIDLTKDTTILMLKGLTDWEFSEKDGNPKTIAKTVKDREKDSVIMHMYSVIRKLIQSQPKVSSQKKQRTTEEEPIKIKPKPIHFPGKGMRVPSLNQPGGKQFRMNPQNHSDSSTSTSENGNGKVNENSDSDDEQSKEDSEVEKSDGDEQSKEDSKVEKSDGADDDEHSNDDSEFEESDGADDDDEDNNGAINNDDGDGYGNGVDDENRDDDDNSADDDDDGDDGDGYKNENEVKKASVQIDCNISFDEEDQNSLGNIPSPHGEGKAEELDNSLLTLAHAATSGNDNLFDNYKNAQEDEEEYNYVSKNYHVKK